MEKIADALTRAIRRGEVGRKALVGLGLKPRTIYKSIGKPGVEGFAQLRTHPEHGLQVAKLHDRQSPWYGDRIFDIKSKLLDTASKADPQHFARQYGVDYDKKIMFSEFLHGPNNAGPRTAKIEAALSKKYGILDFSRERNHNILNNKIYDVGISTIDRPKTRLFDPKEFDSPLAKAIRRADTALQAWQMNAQPKREFRLMGRYTDSASKLENMAKSFKEAVHNATSQEQAARINRILRETYGAR